MIEFSARTRMSGIDLPSQDGSAAVHPQGRRLRGRPVGRRQRRHGAAGVARRRRRDLRLTVEPRLLVAESGRVLGVVHLKDVVKPGIAERFAELRAMGIRTVMITGDTALTAQSIAKEAGVDDFLAEATPEDKLAYIRQRADRRPDRRDDRRRHQRRAGPRAGRCGVAMNSGTTAAKEAGNMVDLDSSPTKLIDIVEIGKQLLITRGALTTFSIANDVAKYFAILPAMFMAAYPGLAALNIMRLSSPTSAILSAVIFNALVIVALIPLAIRGVRYRPTSAAEAAEPQPAHLRARRPDRAVHRDQAHRPRHVPHPRNRVNTMTTTSTIRQHARARQPAITARPVRRGVRSPSAADNYSSPLRLPAADDRRARDRLPAGRPRASVNSPRTSPRTAH